MVSVVIQKLTDMLIEESAVFDKVIDQVEEIRIKLRQMRGILMDAEKQEDKHSKFKLGVQSYLHALYSTEDAVETFVLQVGRRRCRRGKGIFFRAGRVISAVFNDPCARKLRKEMVKISSQIDALTPQPVQSLRVVPGTPTRVTEEPEAGRSVDIKRNNDGDVYRRYKSWNSLKGVPRSKPISSYCVSESSDAASGIESDAEKKLVEELTKIGDDDKGRRVISIVGAGGSGKTTLVRRVYSRRKIKLHFKLRAWVSVSKGNEEDTCRSILESILQQITKVKEHGFLSQEELVSRVREELRADRYVVVMDDARAVTAEVWDSLEAAFPAAARGGRVIFTSCSEEELKFWDVVIPQRPLDDARAWDLLVNKLGMTAPASSCLPELPQERILRICRGSPLSISLLGGLLSSRKVNYDEWSRVLDRLGVREESQLERDLLSLSFNDLPPHSKLCLLYLGLFPKEWDIPVRRLFRLWLAEGFLKRSPEKSPEDLAEEYFNDLVYRNLIQLSKVRSVGNPKKCRMPGFVYDGLCSKAQDISLFHVHRTSATAADDSTFGVRRIVEYADIGTTYESDSSPNLRLRSYLSFNTQKKDTGAEGVGFFLEKMVRSGRLGLLRVLDLEGVYKPCLPDTLGNLFHLRYLGLRWTFVDQLPNSVGNLPYLETLDVKHTHIDRIPKSIWNLKRLRHLNLHEIQLDMPQNSSLTRLTTLWGLRVDHRSLISNGLDRLSGLRELGITCRGFRSDLATWIAGLTSLQSLRLRCTHKDDAGRPGDLNTAKPLLSDLKHLSHLYLLGRLKQVPGKEEFPTTSLKVLTLSLSRLKADPMPTLGQLPCLSVLRLFAEAYVGDKMECHVGGFAKLRVLKLWMLWNLEEWDVKDTAMKKLEKLEIRQCHRLTHFPPVLLNLHSLEDLILTAMPEVFVRKVKENIPPTMSLTDNSHLVFDQPPTWKPEWIMMNQPAGQ